VPLIRGDSTLKSARESAGHRSMSFMPPWHAQIVSERAAANFRWNTHETRRCVTRISQTDG
jgi:hypothetical protein